MRYVRASLADAARLAPDLNDGVEADSDLLLAGMAGTMMVARAVSDRELSDTILAQGQEFYISIFQPRDGRAQG